MRKLCLLSVFLVAGVASADKKKETPKDTKKDPMAEHMAMMAKLATPGPEHEKLKSLVGTWDATTKMWMAPGAAPVESKGGVAKYEMTMDGRFLVEDFTGNMMGKPFTGHGTQGYDNLKKKYVATWIDTWGTGIMFSEGTMDATGKIFTSTSEETDPTGKKFTMRTVVTMNSDKQRTMEMFHPGPDGKEMKGMEIVYTRK